MARYPRSERVQEAVGDIFSRMREDWNCWQKAAFLRSVAHRCFQAAKVLEGRRPDEGR